jgi:hypothetical protein
MSIEDTFFTCSETPIWIPSTFNNDSLAKCISCAVRLTSKIAGPGNVTSRADGLLLNENPTVTIAVNGIMYNLVETILTFPGAHRLQNNQNPSVAELFLYFQNTRDFTQHLCLALPVDVGNGDANFYFASLDTGIRKDRPTIGSILPAGAKYIMYKGADLRGRTNADPRPTNMCAPVKRIITYFLCLTPLKITASDYGRLQARAGKIAGPPKPQTEVVQSRLLRIGTLIDEIKVEKETATTKAKDGGIATNAMKCYKLDPAKDIIENKVYVGNADKPTDNTLAKELERATTDFTEDEAADAAIKPGDIERALGTALGIIVSVVVCAVIAYLVWKYIFRNYLAVQKLYNNPISASAITNKLPSLPIPSVKDVVCPAGK